MRRPNRTTSTDDADVAAGEAAAAAAAAAASAMASAASNFLMSGVGSSSATISPIPSYASPLRPGGALRQQHLHMSDQQPVSTTDGGAGPNGAANPSSTSNASSDYYLSSAPASSNSLFAKAGSDLDFFEDHISEPVLVLGFDISHLSRQAQFLVCAAGVFWFSLLYGYLQELISVQLCNRKLGLFLATAQFTGYTVIAYFLREFVYTKEQRQTGGGSGGGGLMSRGNSRSPMRGLRKTLATNVGNAGVSGGGMGQHHTSVPFLLYLGLSLLRAVDLGMTNVAMQYINYPGKTLIKSSRVVFTMMFGVIISRKSYGWKDYAIVVCMCVGLALFLHADATSSAVFHPMGVIMLVVSLMCDGAITNMSESIMKQFGVGQDEFIFRMYSIALVAITAAAAFNGDLRQGLVWMTQPGTFDELSLPLDQRTWSVSGKWFCLVVFSSMGFFGSSCSAAITKNFGALTMSITSTARKAITLFLSFFIFGNVCTSEHLVGIFIFITALTAKSLRRRGDGKKHRRRKHRATPRAFQQLELEMGMSKDTTTDSVLIPTKGRLSDEYENLIRRTASHESGGNGAASASIDPRDVHIV